MFTKKKYFVVIWIILIFVTGSISINAQKKPSNKLYAEPSRLMFAGDEKEEADEEQANLLREHFYPVGWSKDGKFAFYSEPPDEACGCYFGDLFIQDMRTDKIVWSNEYEGDDAHPDENIKTHWRKRRKLFARKLAEYGIVQSKNFTLRESPLEAANDSVKVDFFSDVRLLEDVYNSEGDVFVKLISKRNGAKTVYQKRYAGKDYDGVISIELGGILISPFEPRTAIILIETHRGWEGPPNVTDLRIIGAALTNGFH